MLCKKCKIVMKPGTAYERKDGKCASRRFDECPVCHYRKYNNSLNPQENTTHAVNKYRNT